MNGSSIRSDRPFRRTRWTLGALGVAIIIVGLALFVQEIPAVRYPGVAFWLSGALVVHDGLVAGVVVAGAVLLRKLGLRARTRAVLSGAGVVGGIMAIVVLPAAWKAAIGTANPTVLPSDYLGNLVRFEIGIAVVTVVVVIALRVVDRRHAARGAAPRTPSEAPQ